MMYFGNLTHSDRVTFEEKVVTSISPVQDKKSREITHFRMSVMDDEGDVQLRKFGCDEIEHLFATERLVIDRGYHSLPRQQDRAIYGNRDLFGATRSQRERIDLVMVGNRLMERHVKLGMKLTRAGVDSVRAKMSDEFEKYQARKYYGTESANASQSYKRLPSADTLLTRYRKYRASGGNPNVFLAPKIAPVDLDLRATADFSFVMKHLGKYCSGESPSKAKVIGKLIDAMVEENIEREASGDSALIEVRCQRTYERYIDKYLDPFAVVMQREGLAAAQKKFGSIENGRTTNIPGGIVMADAWQFHILTLDVTRERYNEMSEEERAEIKKVRRWVTVLIDVATRCVLGFSISRTPNESASLEALRMVFMDKTHLLREAGITGSDWPFRCPIQEMVNDNGSEFGQNPFGGAQFAQAVRRLSASLMNTVAGVSQLRGMIERFFWTADLKWARHLPGYTASNPQKRNDRKPSTEACICDDELQVLFLAFVAEYHNTPHRGLHFGTPAAVWEELTQGVEFDASMMPSPSTLREACGFYTEVAVSEAGIRFAGATYSNKFIRNQRKARVVDRIAEPGTKVEIKVDPFDLGAISVCANGDMISVPCLNPEMVGKSLRQWDAEKLARRQKAEAENLSRKEARGEACAAWEQLAESIKHAAGVGVLGYSQSEVDRAALEEEFGKGHHEKPFIGRDEYEDPVLDGGFEIRRSASDADDSVQDEAEADAPTSMDRFRSSARHRKRKPKNSSEEGS